MTGQTSFIFEEAAPAPETRRETIRRAAAARIEQRPDNEPPPPDYSAFEINPESNYAYDDQHAPALAELCAAELKGYLFSARVLAVALKAGRNPLYVGAPPFTGKQAERLREAAREAESFANWMLSECADAFGEAGALRLHDYARACVDAAVPDEVPAEPEQAALLF